MNPRPRKLLFFLNHPAQYHLFKNSIHQLKQRGHTVKVIIVKKDVLEDLVKAEGWDYINLFPEGRRYKNYPALVTAIVNLFKTEMRLWRFFKKEKFDLLAGTEGTLAHMGFFLRIPSLLFNEDDTTATPENYLFYPFATKVILPACCDIGKWQHKRISYPGYHELAYLHPRYFSPDESKVRSFNPNGDKYFILRLAELSASHDAGKKGISDAIAQKIIEILKPQGRIFISCERPLSAPFEPYRLKINPADIFHVLYFAHLYIGDSQTMAAEAAVLGTPSIRFNDFVGRLGYLEELEHKYELTVGIKTSDEKKLLETIKEVLAMPHLKDHWRNKRKVMLVENVDVANFIMEVIENFLVEKR